MTNAAMGLSYDHLNGERGVTEKIKQAMHDAAKQFVYIGFLLWEVKTYEYFYENNYGSVYEYAEAELGFKRSSTKNFIAICENFCRKDPNYTSLPTMFLDDRWSDYQYSQLTEMLAMSPKQREETKPGMTVKQLREIKKKPACITINTHTGEVDHHEPPNEAIGQTSGQKTGEIACTVNNYWKDLDKADVKDLCFMTGKRFNTRSSYTIQIKPIPKDKNRMDLKRKLCEAAGIEYDPANYDYGITMELKEK